MSATHDWSHKKISYKDKLFLINSLKEKYKILISSEYKLPDEINQFKITLSPEKIHDALYFSDLFIGESGSMSTEAAIMGVPSINLTSSASDVGVFTQLVECKMLHLISNAKQTLDKAIEILNNENYHQNTLRLKVNEFISKKVDMTSLLVWFIENYPDSINVMKENPNYQDHFK